MIFLNGAPVSGAKAMIRRCPRPPVDVDERDETIIPFTAADGM